MAWWINLDEELVGALDANGCFADPVAANDMLDRYGVEDLESQKVARGLLRYIGAGRAEGLYEDEEE